MAWQSSTLTSSFADPCDLVRRTCREWNHPTNSRNQVTIRRDRIPVLGQDILNKSPHVTEWDSDDWHYKGVGFVSEDPQQKRERVGLYLLALDAINFCFWPVTDNDATTTATTETNRLEYEQLAKGLKGLAEADHNDNEKGNNHHNNSLDSYAFSPQNLATMTPTKMKSLLEPYIDFTQYPIPNLETRCELWKELGTVLLRDYHGRFLEFLDNAHGDATKLVELVATSFPGFQDETILFEEKTTTTTTNTTHDQHQQTKTRIVFLKRAQIFVGDVNAGLELNLRNMDRLTTFADYRVPQILRQYEVLEYTFELADRVDSQMELKKDSIEEVSIRAATVVAVEELVQWLNKQQEQQSNDNGKREKFTDVTVDWYLWQAGERMHQDGLLKPFHRVRTHFY